MTYRKPEYDWFVSHAHSDWAAGIYLRNPADFEARVAERYREVRGREVTRGYLNHCIWRAFYEPHRFGAMTTILDDIRPLEPGPDPNPLDRLGTEIPTDKLYGAWLYAEPFWAPARVFPSSDDEFQALLRNYRAKGNICVSVVNFVGGDEFSPKFFGYAGQMDRVVDRLRRANEAGLANVVFAMGNDYLRSEVGFPHRSGWENLLYEYVRSIGAYIGPHTQVYIPLTERGKTLTSDYNHVRRRMYGAAREGMGDRGWIGAHELAQEGVYFEDLKDAGDCMPCIQTGFDRWRDQIREWIEADVKRWRDLERRGNFSGRTLYCAFEHSIPEISPRWRHHQTWEEAQRRGRICLDAGADLDFSGGQPRN